MKLSSLLKKGSLGGFATATPAIFATYGSFSPPTVATVATLAVAKAPDRAANDETASSITASSLKTDSLMKADSVAAAKAYYDHHSGCQHCMAAGRGAGYGVCCEAGQTLWAAYGASEAAVFTPARYDEDSELARLRKEQAARWDDEATIQTAMTDSERECFTERLVLFSDKGVDLDTGEALADKLLKRDRTGDGRRLCLECANFNGRGAGAWRCGNVQRAGIATQARDAQLGTALVSQLQRCDGFTAAQHQFQGAEHGQR